jgi:hypothetical protein
MNRSKLIVSLAKSWLWAIPAIIGGGITILTLFVLPPDRVIDGLVEFLFKITPLVTAVFAIALFPKKGNWVGLLLVLGFIFYMGYIDSVFFIQLGDLLDAAVADTYQQQFPAFYTFHIFVNSFTVLLAIFAYRLGGAHAARVIKVGLSGILVMISGLNDLATWVIYPWPNGERPLVFHWASHVAIFIGRDPNLYHMLAFLTIHLLLIGIIFWLPLEKWIDQQKARWQLSQPSTPVAELTQ